jgi:membrane protein implicated in regulation of membrane protease activity
MVSLFDMLALWFMIGVPIAIGMFAAKHFGLWTGIGAGLFSAIVCVAAVVISYRSRWRNTAQQRREFREKYTRIYRVLAVPTNGATTKKAQGAEIKIGDFGCGNNFEWRRFCARRARRRKNVHIPNRIVLNNPQR